MPEQFPLSQNFILEKLKLIFPHNKKLELINDGYCNADSILSLVCKYLGIFEQLVNLKNKIISCSEPDFPFMAEYLTPLIDFIYSIQVEEKKGNRTDFFKVDAQFNRFRFLLDKLFNIPSDFKLTETFSFPCFFSEADLADLLIRLNTKNSMILVLSEDHTIPIIQEGNSSYWCNDPNFENGPETSDSAQKLVTQLKELFFTDTKSDSLKMPLKLIQFAETNMQHNNNNNLPDKKQLYDLYLSNVNDINDKTHGFSQLNFAATHDDAIYIQKLLALGADPNCKDANGETPLINAIRHGSLNAIYALTGGEEETIENDQQQNRNEASKYADVNATDSADISPLIHIIDILNDIDLVKLMLEKGASVHHSAEKSGYTALLTAVKVANKEIIGLLLENCAQPNQVNSQGETALHMAVKRRNVEITDYLINESYVDPNRRNKQRETAAHLIFDDTEDATLPICTSVELLQAICQGVGENEIDIDAKDNNGDTVLHIACEVEDYASVEYLLSLGASVNIANNQGKIAADLTTDDSIKKLIQQAETEEPISSFSFKDPQSITLFNNNNTNSPSQLGKVAINNLLTDNSPPQKDSEFKYPN